MLDRVFTLCCIGCALIVCYTWRPAASAETAKPAPAKPASPPLAKSPRAGEFAAKSVVVGKQTREYRLVIPDSVDLTQPAPLVVALHGMAIDSKDLMPRYSKLNDTARKHKFLIAYPNALEKHWGIKPTKVAADLAFFDELVAQISTNYAVDSRRIYVLGISNGGYFAHLIGKERSTTVAAVVSHSGVLGLQTLGGIKAERKFPVMIVHGDRDPIFPVAFARENRDKYQREGHPVTYQEIAGGGHLWTDKVDINEEIWKFLKDQALPEK
ncbi:MAG: PHB depolymerase family esterase [Pirellulales bacterium]|nr:PHB depolymerase family esterase [Pirellulales bacterium]